MLLQGAISNPVPSGRKSLGRIHMNDQGLTFHGSILSKGLEITGKSTYIYKKFLSYSAGTGSSGSGNGTGGNANVSFASPPADIDWND